MMCDIDCGNGIDVSTESDVSESVDSIGEIGDTSAFDGMSDLPSDVYEDSSDIEGVQLDNETDYPSLSNYGDLIDETNDIDGLMDIRESLENGEFSEENEASLGMLEDIQSISDDSEDENFTHLDEIQGNLENIAEADIKTLGTYQVTENVEAYSEEQYLSNVHDMLTEVYGIPEGSPELEAIMENERSGYEDLHGYLSEAHLDAVDGTAETRENAFDEVVETEENQYLSNVHDMLTEVYGIPEGSPELEAIMENERSGYEDLHGEVSDSSTEETNEIESIEENALEDTEETANTDLVAADENISAETTFQEMVQPIEDTTIQEENDVHPEVMEDLEDRMEGEVYENERDNLEENPLTDVSEDLNIDYNEIYNGFTAEELEQGFEEINIDNDRERLDSALNDFQQESWEQLSLEEQKGSMSSLADYVIETIGFDNPPRIEYYNNPREGDYGGYNSATNTLRVNEYMLEDSEEAADTIAHELWHAHQRECANDPKSVRDFQYQYNFENYIRPEMGHEAYENQLIEAEARAFAHQFKGRIRELRG